MTDLTGKKISQFVVLRFVGKTNGSQNKMYLCRCSCGTEKVVVGSKLTNKTTKSCGCLRKNRFTVHGLSITEKYTHTSWRAMIDPCYRRTDKQYKDYGGRGITVCGRWLSFQNFFTDMGRRPKGLTIDRVDNYGNYRLGNCRWATRSEQQQNRRDRQSAIGMAD